MIKLISISEKPEMKRQLKELYFRSFPKEERVPWFFMNAKSRKDGANLYGVYDGDIFVGLVHEVYFRDITYVFFLAVSPKLRGKGYGGAVLEEIKRKNEGRRVILNIETLDEECDNREERVRRKNFYLKNGFNEAGYKTRENNVLYEMLYYGGIVSEEEYSALIEKYLGKFFFKFYYKKIGK